MTQHAAEIDQAPVHHLAETGSTNEDALALARGGTRGPLWIRADRQVLGRGRQGRTWESPVGNLYCSLLVPVAADPRVLPQLSHVAAVALVQAVEAVAGPVRDLHIKWPNDLLIGGAKVAGILVEATRAAGAQVCVIGCGVNCRSHPDGLPYRAAALSVSLGRPVLPDELFAALRVTMVRALILWNDGEDFAAIQARWLAHALPLDTSLTVRAGREPLEGRFQGIDNQGRLLLLGPDGPLTVEAGDVIVNESGAASRG